MRAKESGKKKPSVGCLAVVFVLVFLVAFFSFLGTDEEDSSTSSTSEASASDENAAGSPAPTEVPVDDNLIDTNISDTHITYDHYDITTIGDGDYITLYFQFTNNSEDDNKAFFTTADVKAFQNGVELQASVVYTSDETRTAESEVQPGTTTMVAEAFRLQDRSEIEIEISPWISLTDELTDSATISIE